MRTALRLLLAFASSVPLLILPGAAAAQDVAAVTITPERASVVAGETVRFTAAAADASGAPLRGLRVRWFAPQFDIGGIDANGTFHAVRPGRAVVFAVVEGRPASATVEIAPRPPTRIELAAAPPEIVVGGLAVLEAVAFTEDGDPRPGVEIGFRSLDEGVARVDAGGVVTGLAPGTARIAATAGNARGEIAVRVIENPVRRLTVTGPGSARTGDVVRFAAEARDAGGAPIASPPVRWAVSGEGATVYPDGALVAERPGTYVVTALAGSTTASASISIARRVHARRLEAVGRVGIGDLQAAELWVTGSAAYLSTLSNRLYVFDLSDPTKPVKVDSVLVDAAYINDVSTTADGRIGVLTREGASTRRNGLVFLDLADPLHPKVLSEYTETLSGGVHSAYIDGHHVYATDDATGALRIIDFSDPAAPREVARWAAEEDVGTDPTTGLARGQYLHDVQVKDGLAYLAYWRHGLIILDVGAGIEGGSPESPKFVSRITYDVTGLYPPDMLAGTHAVFRYGDYVFLGDEVWPAIFDLSSRERIDSLGRVHVIDVSDIRRPRKVAEYNVQDMGSHNLWIEDDVMYIGYYEGGVRAVDVSGDLRGDLMAQGREIGSVWTGAPDGYRPNLPMAWGAQPHRGFVYSSDLNSGIWVTRLTSPPVP